MDAGELLFIISRLSTGAAAAFLAIMLWSKTRDIAWMLMVTGTITVYVETVYLILERFGIAGKMEIGTVTLGMILLSNIRMGFFIAAFAVMLVRKFKR